MLKLRGRPQSGKCIEQMNKLHCNQKVELGVVARASDAIKVAFVREDRLRS